MADVFNKLKRGTYRSIPFYYQSTSESSGFKYAEHTYPGSDNFTIEQLGKRPKRFNIEGKVDYDRRDDIDVALNTPGSGILSHPLYGNFIVKVLEYTKTDSKDELGFYSYSMVFAVEIGLIIPRLSTVGLQAISTLRATGVTAAGTALQSGLSGIGL